MMDLEEVTKRIRWSRHRATPQRLAVYEALCNAGSHPTVTEIYECARRRDPTISLATVYKTLQLFLDIGIVREMGYRNGSTRYDPEMAVHLNLVCIKCGCVDDYEVDLADTLSDVSARTGFLIREHRFEIHGVCSKCKLHTQTYPSRSCSNAVGRGSVVD
ncbi:MAG: transcriptional repressor [Candidatus Thorarchaeota archaeon]|nr:transcriptional repressor [Candidatus Thorarchaeota archaeon]